MRKDTMRKDKRKTPALPDSMSPDALSPGFSLPAFVNRCLGLLFFAAGQLRRILRDVRRQESYQLLDFLDRMAASKKITLENSSGAGGLSLLSLWSFGLKFI